MIMFDVCLNDLIEVSNNFDLLLNNIEAEKMHNKKEIYLKEENIQSLIVEYLEYKGLLFHPSLSGIYTESYKIKRKMYKQGVRKGYPDLYIIKNNGGDKIFFLELKTVRGRPTAEQLEKIKSIQAEGIPVSVSYGIYDAVYKIGKYLACEPVIYEIKENKEK